MKEDWQHNFERVREVYRPVFDKLDLALIKLDVDFYLIGAQSRDLWTAHIDIERRTTADIDYCVYVPDRATWNALTQYLTSEAEFRRDTKLPYRFYAGNQRMDVIPFGGLEDEDGEVMLDNPRIELSVWGTGTVLEDATVSIGNFKVVTLPGLCVMKLIAFSEKPDMRAKDWGDFMFLLQHYADIAGANLYDGPYEDLLTLNMELGPASARMLGRQMTTILNKNEALRSRVVATLSRKCDGHSREDIDQMYLQRDREDIQLMKY